VKHIVDHGSGLNSRLLCTRKRRTDNSGS